MPRKQLSLPIATKPAEPKPATAAPLPDVSDNPFANTVAVLVSQHRFGVRRKVRENEATAVSAADDQPLSPEAVSLSKRLIRSEEYDAITSADGQLRADLRKYSVPSVLRDGVVLVPLALFPAVHETIEQYRSTREILVAAFVASYDRAIDDAKVTLGRVFDAEQYPKVEEVEARFSVDVSYVDFSVSGALASVDASLFEAEKKKLAGEMAAASREIRSAMRAGLLGLVVHLTDRLSGTTDEGKPKIFRDTAVTNLTEWLELFDFRNVTGDRELAGLAEKCKALVATVDPETLRKDLDVRAKVASELSAVKSALDGLMTAKPSRKFDLDEVA